MVLLHHVSQAVTSGNAGRRLLSLCLLYSMEEKVATERLQCSQCLGKPGGKDE